MIVAFAFWIGLQTKSFAFPAPSGGTDGSRVLTELFSAPRDERSSASAAAVGRFSKLSADSVAKLDALLSSPRFSGAAMCASVTDMDGNVLYAHDDSRHVVPASNQKLLTSAFALDTLGPDYRPVTKFWKQPYGLYVDTEGTPMLTYPELEAERKKLGRYNTRGVFVNEAYRPGIPPTWELDDLPNKYAAPVTAFTIDRGSFELWSLHGKPALKPKPFGVKIVWHKGSQPWTSTYDPFTRVVVVSGKLPAKDVVLDTLALPKPDEAAASVLGMRYLVKADAPQSPPDDVLVGPSTIEIVQACLPPSDNNLAEHLFMLSGKRLSVRSEDPYVASEREMTRFLTTVVGISPSDLHVVDGSGMSRQNFVTTRAITRLLMWGSKQPTGPAWKAAMASPANGTLRNRLAGVQFSGKTGSLGMVSSLSGYLRTKGGTDLIVSLVFNQFTAPASEAHKIQDDFIRVLNDL